MAELTTLYADQDTAQTTTSGTYSDITLNNPILGTDLVGNNKYLIVARALIGVDSATNKGYFRVETPDDTDVESKSEVIVEFEQTGSTDLLSYFFPLSFTTAATPSDVNLQFKVDGSSTMTADQLSLLLFDLGPFVEGTDYYEDIQAVDTGTEYSTSVSTTVLAQILGSDLGTDEHLILGYARVDVGSAGRWFVHHLFACEDEATAQLQALNQAEGEDTDEQRVSGFSIRHKASSGTPNVTIYGQEEAANGNMTDGGAYLIALPASLFADLEYSKTGGPTAVDGTETTLTSVTSYTPTTTGNHLVFGGAEGFSTPTQLGGMWVEEGTTEIRTGDSTPTHNQIWDNTKDNEHMNTFQRYSISSAVTLNLQAQGAAADFDLARMWLIVVNLNAASGDQTITGSLLSRSPTFPTGAVNPGGVTITGSLLSRSPTFPTGTVQAANTIGGVLLSRSPTFPTGIITPGNVDIGGILLSRTPTFPTGTVQASNTINGVLLSRSPTFPIGAVSSEITIAGSLLSRSPSFPTGSVLPGNVNIGGTLLSRSGTFPIGVVSLSGAPQTITGSLLSRSPSFPTGSINPGDVTIGGILLSRSPTFPTGVVSSEIIIGGVLLSRSPTFPTGTVSSELTITGVLLSRSPSFPAGSINPGNVTVSGILLARSPVFPIGSVASAIIVSGVLLARSPSFPTGSVLPGGVVVSGILLSRSPTFPIGAVLLTGVGWWTKNPADYAQNPVGFTKTPAGFTKTPVGFTKNPADYTKNVPSGTGPG